LAWLPAPWPPPRTGNHSFPRAWLRAVGGCASELVGGGLEDVELGLRLCRAGACFVCSRFALGRHVVDPSEPASRNPFRAPAPTREDFAGYLANLERMAARHAGELAVERYVPRALADIEEACGPPGTVGLQMGCAARLP